MTSIFRRRFDKWCTLVGATVNPTLGDQLRDWPCCSWCFWRGTRISHWRSYRLIVGLGRRGIGVCASGVEVIRDQDGASRCRGDGQGWSTEQKARDRCQGSETACRRRERCVGPSAAAAASRSAGTRRNRASGAREVEVTAGDCEGAAQQLRQ